MLTLVLGGARSGKSRLAQRLAMKAGQVIFVATAQATGDLEMLARIAHHRDSRPSERKTIEEPLALARAVESAASDADAILVDCLTVWLSNLFWEYRDEAPRRVEEIWRWNLQQISSASHGPHIILVSNELGSGTVPDVPVTRAFRDAQGLLNQQTAELGEPRDSDRCRPSPLFEEIGFSMSAVRIMIAGTHAEIEYTGIKARGHEFRYSAIDPMPDCSRRAYQPPVEGYKVHSVPGSYTHLHFGSCPDFAERFVHDCAIHRARKAR